MPSQHDRTSHNHEPSIVETVQSLKSSSMGYLASKAELASIEAKEAATHAKKKISLGLTTAFFAFFTYALFLILSYGVISHYLSSHLEAYAEYLPVPYLIVLGMFLFHLLILFIYLIRLSKKPKEEWFAVTKSELQKDKQWLQEMNNSGN